MPITQPASGRIRLARLAVSVLTMFAMIVTSLFVIGTATSGAAVPNGIIDDFEDGDTSDWGFFGTPTSGGGGGPAGDRPKEGAWYFSTGWGGTGAGFYGGGFKNFPDAAQVQVPADPWLNAWVLNQSDATVDGYTLELTIREDLDGNGWTDGAEDSFRFDTSFVAADFDDEWRLISAPLSSLINLNTGGDGTFDGALDEIVLVVSGVTGPDPSAVELDLDLITFTSGGPLDSGAPPVMPPMVFDDMEHGDPFGNGWFAFNGAVGGGGLGPNTGDLPPSDGGAFSIETGWGSGGVAGFYGGFGRTNPMDLTGKDHFNFWINPDAGQDYTLELNFQEDDDPDTTGPEEEFQFNCEVSATGPCAVSGGGWQHVSIPFSELFDDNSFLPGGNGVFDATGPGGLQSVVVAVIGTGSDVNLRSDYWTFSSGALGTVPSEPPPAMPPMVFDDMEHGDPFGNGWFAFNGAVGGGGLGPNTGDLPPSDGGAFSIETGWGSGGVAGFYGGFGRTNPMDLTGKDHFNFWINPNADQDYTLELNFQEDDDPDTAGPEEEFQFNCVVSATGPCATSGGGWQLISIPFSELFDDNSFLPGGNGTFDPFGPGALDTMVVAVIGTGSDVNFRSDYWTFSSGPLGAVPQPPPATAVECTQTGPDPTPVTAGDGPLIDDFEAAIGSGTDADGVSVGFITFSGANSGVGIDIAATPPAPVLPVIGSPNSVLRMDIDSSSFAGFVNVFANADNDAWVPQDWSASEGLSMWFCGTNSGSTLFVDVLDDRNPGSTTDDAERWSATFTDDFLGWQELTFPFASMTRKDIGNNAPNDEFELFETHGYALGALGTGGPLTFFIDEVRLYGEAEIPELKVGFETRITDVAEGSVASVIVKLNRPLTDEDPETVTVEYRTEDSNAVPGEEFTPTSATVTFTRGGPTTQTFPVTTFDDSKWEGDERVVLRLLNPTNAALSILSQGSLMIRDNDAYNPAIIDDFTQGAYLWWSDPNVAVDAQTVAASAAGARPGQDTYEQTMQASVTGDGGSFGRDFPLGEDWSGTDFIDVWFKGTGSGQPVTVTLKDNRAPDPGPEGWNLVWSDEFNGPAGAAPDPSNWGFEIGDTTPDGKNGWGNDERQYYTDDSDNASTDGAGNLKLTLDEADGSRECYYGTCEYESARLLSMNRAEFAYGRIESRLKVPEGQGIWPAFWSLGIDIPRNPWPASGEIDIMEFVGREPNEIFGTIHGPGYSGGASFGGSYDSFGEEVPESFHTFTVEWEPNKITWYVDGIQYHQATPADVAPNEWVFEKPFFLLLNVAIGGNFGGPIGDDLTYPQSMLVDYVRVYQGPDTAERFETTIIDHTAGWKKLWIPIADFERSANQPAGAPDDGLGLDEVWGYGFSVAAPGDYGFDMIERAGAEMDVTCPAPTTPVDKNADGVIDACFEEPSEPEPVPTEEPQPEPEPTEEPQPEPTEEPAPAPTEEPQPEPTEEPAPVPTEEPTAEPTGVPAPEPTVPPAPPVPTAEPVAPVPPIPPPPSAGLVLGAFDANGLTVFDPYNCGAGFFGDIGGGVAPYTVSYVITGPAVAFDLGSFQVGAAGRYDSPPGFIDYSVVPDGQYSVSVTVVDSSVPPLTLAQPNLFSAVITDMCAVPAPAVVTTATTGHLVTADAPAATPKVTAPTPATEAPKALALTGTNPALAQWALMLIALGLLAVSSPWRRRERRT